LVETCAGSSWRDGRLPWSMTPRTLRAFKIEIERWPPLGDRELRDFSA